MQPPVHDVSDVRFLLARRRAAALEERFIYDGDRGSVMGYFRRVNAGHLVVPRDENEWLVAASQSLEERAVLLPINALMGYRRGASS